MTKEKIEYILADLVFCKKDYDNPEITTKDHEELVDAILKTIEKLGYDCGGTFSPKTEADILDEEEEE
jgi:hypothetical protein